MTSGNLLGVTYEYVGNSGTGSFAQSGGSNDVGVFLYLGNSSSGSGTYSLTGGTLFSSNYVYVGYSGTGSFTQSGGRNLCYDIALWR